MITRLVSCPEELPPVDETGEPTVEVDTVGECLAVKRDAFPTAEDAFVPVCESPDKLAMV